MRLLRLSYALLIVSLVLLALEPWRVEAVGEDAPKEGAEELPLKNAEGDSQTQKKQDIPLVRNEEEPRLARMKTKMVVGIRTTGAKHARVVEQQDVWARKEFEEMIETYSDVRDDVSVPNLVYTVFDTNDEYATWMKVTHMMKVWATPPYKSVDWFIVTHDGAYVNLDNLFDYVMQLNASHPTIIGEVHCRANGVQYLNGKASLIFNRGFLDSMVWDFWYAPERSGIRRSRYDTNLFWGDYLNALALEQLPFSLINHPGMLSVPYTSDSDLLQYYARFTTDKWPLPFRPISSDQTLHLDFLPQLHRTIQSLSREPAPTLFTIPSCQCKKDLASRCLPDHDADENDVSCIQPAASLKCIGCDDCA